MRLERKTVNLAVKWAYVPKHANLNLQYTAGVGHQVNTEEPRLSFVTRLTQKVETTQDTQKCNQFSVWTGKEFSTLGLRRRSRGGCERQSHTLTGIPRVSTVTKLWLFWHCSLHHPQKQTDGTITLSTTQWEQLAPH